MPFLVGYATPQDYGAVGDGVTDDTAAIQAALAAVAITGGTLFFPPATYAVKPVSSTAAAITWNNGTTGYKGVRLVGSSSGGSHIKKTANGPIFDLGGPSSDLTGATHAQYCSLEHVYLDGNSLTGTMIQAYYADDLWFNNVHFVNNLDTVIQTAELWDSRFDNCVWDSCGSTTPNATAPNVWLCNTVAGSGFGASTDTVNQIYFHDCRWEGFTTGAVRIERGPGGGTGQPTGIHFTRCKMETIVLNGGNHLFVDTPCQDIYASQMYFYLGGFHGGYSTAQDVISFSPQVGGLRDTFIFNASGTACVANGVTVNSPLTNGMVALENVRGKYATNPTGAHLNYGGTNTGPYRVNGVSADNGTQVAGTVPTLYAANQPLNVVNGSVSDGSFASTPNDGTLGLDSLNKRLWARVAGVFSRIPLNTIASSVTSTTTVSASGLSTLQASSNAAANEPQAGSRYVVEGEGTFTTTGSQTIAFTLYWGTTAGTVIASIPAITPAALTNGSFSYRAVLTFRSTTSVVASLTLDWNTSTATNASTRYTSTPSAATTVVTTGATPITVGVTWSATGSSISLMGGLSSKVN